MDYAKRYELLPAEVNEQETADTMPKTHQRSCLTRRAVWLAIPLLILTAVIITIQFSNTISLKKTTIWTHCGNSTSEAKANGCRFDVMMHSWVPQECYDEELSEEYIQANEFKFFSDPKARVEVPMEVVRLGEFTELYTGLSHHVLHCTYIWRLLMLSATQERPFDSLSSSEDHTGHCGAILLHGLPWTKPFFGNESTLSPDFLSCGYY